MTFLTVFLSNYKTWRESYRMKEYCGLYKVKVIFWKLFYFSLMHHHDINCFHEGRHNPIQQMCYKNGIEKSDALLRRSQWFQIENFALVCLVNILSLLLFFFLISSKGVYYCSIFQNGNAFSGNFHAGFIILCKYSILWNCFHVHSFWLPAMYNGYQCHCLD